MLIFFNFETYLSVSEKLKIKSEHNSCNILRCCSDLLFYRSVSIVSVVLCICANSFSRKCKFNGVNYVAYDLRI